MSYFNRKTQLYNTLNTIKLSNYKNYEIIIIDDGSDPDQAPDQLCKDSHLPIKLIKIENKNKWYSNPCIPYNIGFKHTDGDYIIIQNAECLHLGGLINYTNDNLNNEDYLVYCCYSLTEQMSQHISTFDFSTKKVYEDILNYINPPENRPISHCADKGWYSHPIYRQAPLHFCAAITKENLNKLNGFDERYATGVAYDDNEFIERIRKMKLNIKYVTSPLVLHQFHPLFNYQIDQHVNQLRVDMNQKLFTTITVNEKEYTAKNARNLISCVPYDIIEYK